MRLYDLLIDAAVVMVCSAIMTCGLYLSHSVEERVQAQIESAC